MSYIKNGSGQFLYFTMISAADGSAITSGTVNGYRSIDGAAQAAVTGTISHKGNGQWELALSQADINGDEVGFLFTHTSGIPVSLTVKTQLETPAVNVTKVDNTSGAAAVIADEVLMRSVANTEDGATSHSLTALILAAFESAVSGSTWTIRKLDGTTFTTRTVTTDANAEPITGVT